MVSIKRCLTIIKDKMTSFSFVTVVEYFQQTWNVTENRYLYYVIVSACICILTKVLMTMRLFIF